MERRIHSKKPPRLSYRHYLLHFKWPLILVTMLFICLSSLKINFHYSTYSSNDIDYPANQMVTDVIYPLDVLHHPPTNDSILYYLKKKDQLKSRDDQQAMQKKQKTIVPMHDQSATHKSFQILEYTTVFYQPRFCSHQKEQIFGKTCPYTNCEYSCNLTLENTADVLLMHKRDLNFPKLDQLKRNPDQIWLLWHDESNENTPAINKYRFNWTITYRTSAEASLAAYGITIVKSKPWSQRRFNAWIEKEFNQRTNQAVWFVSNCLPKQRLKNFRLLRQYYPIAAFGKCIAENESLSLDARQESKTACGRHSSCEKVYLSRSKFYLAFESQTCTDYITEKFWRTLFFGVIPIVSGPKRENFERVAPPFSFIHVDDYRSMEELATALQAIASNRTLFTKYHAWRKYYDVYHEAKDLDPYRFCELCYRLNTNRQRIWYENLNDWFLENC